MFIMRYIRVCFKVSDYLAFKVPGGSLAYIQTLAIGPNLQQELFNL